MTNHERIKNAFSGVRAPEGLADRILKSKGSTATAEPIKLRQRRKLAAIVVIVILTIVVTSTVFAYAQIIDFSRLYRLVFGEGTEHIEPHIIQLTTEEQNDIRSHQQLGIADNQDNQSVLVSESHGIVIALISAINDRDALYIFCTVQDTTDDRLNQGVSFNDWHISQGGGGGTSVVDYDSDTKTSTILITSIGEHHEGNATLRITSILVDRGETTIWVHWRLSFNVPKKATTEFTVAREITINNEPTWIESIYLSPLGVTLELPGVLAIYYEREDIVYVKYEDGTVIPLDNSTVHSTAETSTLRFWGDIIAFEKVRAIIINQEVILLQPTR